MDMWPLTMMDKRTASEMQMQKVNEYLGVTFDLVIVNTFCKRQEHIIIYKSGGHATHSLHYVQKNKPGRSKTAK